MSDDQWTVAGSRITDELLHRLQSMIENESDLIVEHRFYRGGRAPHRFVCSDFSELARYLKTRAAAGDSFLFWRFEDCCRDDNSVESGKLPDSQGRVPTGGAY